MTQSTHPAPTSPRSGAPRRTARRMLHLALLLALCLGALPFTARPAGATNFNLAVTLTTDTNHACATTGTGACSLRDAIRYANSKAAGDTTSITLPAGTYLLTQTGANEDNAATGDLDIKAHVIIAGAGQATTSIDGNAIDRVFDVAAGASLGLDGVAVQHGSADLGGGIRNAGVLTLVDSAVRNNIATGLGNPGVGGGIYDTDGATLALFNSTVGANKAGGGNLVGLGGGIFHFGTGAMTLTDSVVTFNEAAGNSVFSGDGGGIYHSGAGPLTLANSTVSLNAADGATGGSGTGGFAGGIRHSGPGPLTLTSSTVSGNTAAGGTTSQGGSGGGIDNSGGTLTLTNSTVRDNTAGASGPTGGGGTGGGIEHNASEPLTITNSTISGNSAGSSPKEDGRGGGIIVYGSGANTIVNTTISGNDAGATGGGGVRVQLGGVLTLTNTTVANNSSGLSMQAGGAGSLTARNTIVAGNTGASCAGVIANGGRNLDSGATCGFAANNGSSSNTDPKLGPLSVNVPGTVTTHALLIGSPAIDRVPTNGANCPATDARGVARPQGAACDSGAYEYAAAVNLTVATVGGGTVGRAPLGSGNGPFGYAFGTLVTLTPQPNAGQTFTGWVVDGAVKGWAAPLTLTMNGSHTVQATFKPTVTFADTGAGRADYAAIVALASRGSILGYNSTPYGPDNGIQRAQMAALIARAMPAGPGVPPTTLTPPACTSGGTWDCEVWGTNFTDQNGLDSNLWRDVAALQHYGVAQGYTQADCAAKGKAYPCYDPTAPVSYVETVVFITRAMIAKGYWTAQPAAPQPYAGVPAVFASTVATYQFYTQGAGGIPTPPADWNAGATRGWFARTLWQALNTYWGTDGQLPSGQNAGGFMP